MGKSVSKNQNVKCQAVQAYTNESICVRDVWSKDEQRCIFHCQEKDVNEFKEQFVAELKQVNETEAMEEFDCSGFVFPDNVSFEHVEFRKKTNFREATFGDKTEFVSVKFIGHPTFFRVRFLGEALFEKLELEQIKSINFTECNFVDPKK